MPRVVVVQSAMLAVLIGVGLLLLFGPVRSWPIGQAQAGAAAATPTLTSWRDAVPPENLNLTVPSVLPTPAPGETLVYFVPTDSPATGTVLNFYNTDSATHTVTLRGYYYNGAQIYFLAFSIPAYSFQRLASDSIAASPPSSWTTPIPYIASFGDSVYFASLSLPKGVQVDGYTLFDPSTGTIDPNADQGEIPLRFSADPATVLLPTVRR